MTAGFISARELSPNDEFVVDLVGQFDSYLMASLDANCACVVERYGGFYVVPFGRINGEEYQDKEVGPFQTRREAYKEAEIILEEAE